MLIALLAASESGSSRTYQLVCLTSACIPSNNVFRKSQVSRATVVS